MRSLAILGSTGSIGTQALDVVRRNADRFKVVGLSAGGTNQDLFVGQVREFLPPLVAIADEDAADDVKNEARRAARGRADHRSRRHRDRRSRLRGRRGGERAGRIGGAGPHARGAAERQDARARQQGEPRRGRRARDGPDQGRAGAAAPRRLRARRAGDGASWRASRRPEAGRPDRLGRSVPWMDALGALQGVGQGGAPAPGVDHGPEDHDRLRHADEQGPRGDRGALPVRPGLLPDPRADPPRGRGPRDGGVQGWQHACRDGSSRHASPDPARARLAGAPADRRRSPCR